MSNFRVATEKVKKAFDELVKELDELSKTESIDYNIEIQISEKYGDGGTYAMFEESSNWEASWC